jgi:hypothetical protein
VSKRLSNSAPDVLKRSLRMKLLRLTLMTILRRSVATSECGKVSPLEL